jgi:hypothetical protein
VGPRAIDYSHRGERNMRVGSRCKRVLINGFLRKNRVPNQAWKCFVQRGTGGIILQRGRSNLSTRQIYLQASMTSQYAFEVGNLSVDALSKSKGFNS